MSKTIVFLMCGALFLSCAKPTDPESLTPGSGGYEVVARMRTPGYAQDVKVKDTVAYVAQGEGGLAIVNISNRARPGLLSICQDGVKGYSYKIALKDSVAYLAAGGFHVNTINIGDPCAPSFVQNQGSRTTLDVEVFGTWLIAAYGEYGVQIGDLSGVPGYIDLRGTFQNPGYAHGMATTVDSSMLLACGEMGLAVYDFKDIGQVQGFYDASKKPIAWLDLPGYAVDVTTPGNRSIAYVACGTGGIQIVDFSDTSNVRVVGSYATGGYAKEVVYQNNRLYVTTELRGLQIFGVENPAAPRLIGVVHTEYALGVAVDQHYVYVADETEGLIVIAIPQ